MQRDLEDNDVLTSLFDQIINEPMPEGEPGLTEVEQFQLEESSREDSSCPCEDSISELDYDDALLTGFIAQWSMNHQIPDKALTALLQGSGINFRVKPHVVLKMKKLISKHAKEAIELVEETVEIEGRQIPVAYASPVNIVESMMIQAAKENSFYFTAPAQKQTYKYSAEQADKHLGKRLKESSRSGEVSQQPEWQIPPPSREPFETSLRWVKGPLQDSAINIESPHDAIAIKSHLLISADGGRISKRLNKTLIR